MATLKEEKQRELIMLNKAIQMLPDKIKSAMEADGADKPEIFSDGITRYIEFRFNKTMLQDGFDDGKLEGHMFVPLAVLNWYITKESETIANLYIKYDMKVLSLSELAEEIEKHVVNIIDARLGMLRLGKLDA